MEADCGADKCFIHDYISEQLTNSSTINATIAATLNGELITRNLTMHHGEVNDVIFDNDSFHNANIGFNESASNVASGPNITDLIFAVVFCLLIIIVIIGNTLVILSVLTTRRLRTVTNLFVTSLAVADWLVGIFVMPPAVAYYLMGSWHLGWTLCKIWISLDVLLCTASILSLCAISIDRYLAVTQPLNYSRRRRSKRLATLMIVIVWILAIAITCPPILGWYEPDKRDDLDCRYNENKGYVVFSAMGSFFLPMLVMVYVYLRISCVVANRHDDMLQIKVHQSARTKEVCNDDYESDIESRACQSRKRSADQLSAVAMLPTKANSPIHPNQNLVKCVEKLQNSDDALSKNGHYELIDIGKIPSESSLKINSTVPLKEAHKNSTHWHPSEKINDLRLPTQATSMTNINHNNNIDKNNGNQQLSASNFCTMRSRTQTKSLSTRISSLKRESKTTRTLSIGRLTRTRKPNFRFPFCFAFISPGTMNTKSFIACWLPFFIQYLMVPFYPNLKNSFTQNILTWLGWINSAINPFIYAFYSEDFRAAFYRLTFRRFCLTSKKKPPYPISSVSTRR